LEKRTRRRFSTNYKLKILAEADRCQHGELGVLLRREKLYSSQLQQWRREWAAGGLSGVGKTAPGPRPAKTAAQRRIEQLEKENARLQKKLQVTEDCVALQKKAFSMLDRARNGNDE
jgi:transposase-like protein